MSAYPWLVRRELWERRAIWILPAIVGGLMIFTALFGSVRFGSGDSPFPAHAAGPVYLGAIGGIFFAVASLYAPLYLLDCLYDDRRDKSILFWKSLPVSDTQTVLSKLLVGVFVIPALSVAAADVTSLIVSFILSIRHFEVGGSLWQAGAWLQLQWLWLYLIVSAAVWYLPLVGWLLVVSAGVKRAPMLWSVVPLLVAFLLEKYFLGTHYVAAALVEQFAGYGHAAFKGGFDPSNPARSVSHLIDLNGFCSNPHTWIGAAVGAVLIVAAIQLRMRRAEI